MTNLLGLPIFPDELTLIYYVSYCFDQLNLRYTTIKLYLSGLRHFCILDKGIDPFIQNNGNPLIQLPLYLRSIKRLQTPLPKKRKPITAEVLRSMFSVLSYGLFDPYTDCLFAACASLAFFAFLRCGEFCVSASFDPTVNLTASDIIWDDDAHTSFSIRLKRSKTDPFRQGIMIPLSRLDGDDPICPVRNMSKYWTLRSKLPFPPEGPFFVHDNVALTRCKFIAWTRQVLSHTSHSQEGFSGHSYRAGAATSCANAQIEDHLVKTLGRWASDSYQRYITTTRESISIAHKAMSRSPSV